MSLEDSYFFVYWTNICFKQIMYFIYNFSKSWLRHAWKRYPYIAGPVYGESTGYQ